MSKSKLSFLLNTLFWLLCASHLCAQTIDLHQLEKNAAEWLHIPSVSLKDMPGGLTNISFVGTNAQDTFVVRIGKKDPEIFGINRFCEAACQESASQIGIAPKVLYSNPANGTLISSFIQGETFATKKIGEFSQLERIIQLIKKCHAIPHQKEFETFSIYEKIRAMITVSQSAEKPFISGQEAAKIRTTINQIEAHFHEKEKMYAGLCHGDLFPSNFIDDGKQLWLIDWEYACWDNILFDLASLCIELDLEEQKTKDVLKLYFGQTWQEHYIDFELMRAIFNLRNAFWYDLRSKEVAAIGKFTMADYAKKHFDLFKQGIEKFLPDTLM